MRSTSYIAGCLLLALAATAVPAGDDEYAWILEIPKEKIRRMVRDLEAAPLSKDAESLRSVLVTYFDAMEPEFELCLTQIGPLMDAKKRAHKDLWFHVAIASGDYLLEHPEDIDSRYAYQLAGLEGAIRVYERMLQEKSKLAHPFMDELRALRDAGKLGDYVRSHMCDEGGSSSN